MMQGEELLTNCWYVAAHASELKPGRMLSKTLLGQEILLGRDAQGRVFAVRDFCPHRGIPLRYGSFDGATIECCYHGWCFNTQGVCTAIPTLLPDDKTDISKIKTPSYPCQEINALVWVFVPPPGTRNIAASEEPDAAPLALDYRLVEQVEFPCHIDQAVIGLMDPSHGPFVHKSWWWRTRRSMHVKHKQFAPYKQGFRMISHKPSTNSRAYKILGASGERSTEITFQLPGLRTEHIRIGTKNILLLTALTPINGQRTMLHQFIATDLAWANAVLPLLKPFGKVFIKQDLDIVKKQSEGLKPGHAPLLLLGDADQQAVWYYKLKKDFLAAQAENRAFENRIPEKTLSWRS